MKSWGGDVPRLEGAQGRGGEAGEGSHTKGRPVFTPAGWPGADRGNDTTDRGSSLAGSGEVLQIKASGAVTGDGGSTAEGKAAAVGKGWGQGRVEVGQLSLLLYLCMLKPGQ